MALFSPWGNQQFFDDNGNPATGWKIYAYAAGSNTPLATFTTSAGDVAQSQPIILNSLGFPTNGQIFLTSGLAYKLVLTNASDVVKKTADDITGVTGTSTTSQWQASGLTPTYVSATSFTLSGDQTSAFHVGRRLQSTTTAGTIYSTITATAYTTLTTVTVSNDSGVLDSGLAAVNYALLTSTNNSIPGVVASATQAQTYTAFTTAGTSTAYTLTPSPAITAYTAGQSFFVNFNAASGAAPTLKISGIATPPNLVKQLADGTYANIAANNIPINHRSSVTLLSETQALVERLPPPKSSVRVQSSNGYGSTNTMIKRYSNVLENVGADITYADSATLGASFTVGPAGMYAISIISTGGGTNIFGSSKNSAQLTTSVLTITAADRLILSYTSGGNATMASNTVYLAAGAVVRPHTDGTASSTAAQEQFVITGPL